MFDWLILDSLPGLLTMPYGQLAAAMILTAITASLVTLSVPGIIMPLTFSSSLLLGTGFGMAAILAGVLIGSLALFAISRRALAAPVQARFGDRLEQIQEHLAARGALYVIAMRLTGVPHVLVTTGCAMTRMSARVFAAASLVGMLPAIMLAAAAGSAL